MTKLNILYLSPGPEPLAKEPELNKFSYLSKYLRGLVLSTHWGNGSEKDAQAVEAADRASGDFTYLVYYISGFKGYKKSVMSSLFLWSEAVRAHKKDSFDVICAYGPFRIGLIGYLLSKRLGVPFIIEVPGNPTASFTFVPGLVTKLKKAVSTAIARLVVKGADGIRLLYPSQVDGLGVSKDRKKYTFHDFTWLGSGSKSVEKKPQIIFAGFPWKLKGVDILIKAFNEISDKYPDHQLKIIGYCADRTPFENLVKHKERVHFYPGQDKDVLREWLEESEVFVLPSRTEAMGRVLLEAMSVGVSVVGSKVDGIPHYIEDGVTGLLFEKENHLELAAKLEELLSDKNRAGKMADEAKQRVFEKYSADEYSRLFAEMVEEVAGS